MSVITACSGSVSVGKTEVPQSDVESTVAAQLASVTKQPTPKISCPGGLASKIGAAMDCTLTPQGESTVLPVHVAVDSIDNGTAHFSAQVGQAPGGGDKEAFCRDNVDLDKATSGSQQPSDLIPKFKANESTLDDFRSKAPAAIIADAGTLVKAAKDSIASGDASAFTTPEIVTAGKNVDAFCAQNSDGSPAGSTPTTAGDATPTTVA